MPKLNAPGAPSTAPDLSAPDHAALLARATEYTLPSGRQIWWLAPDEMELLAFTGLLPDPLTASVYLLLRDEGALSDADDPASYQRELSHLKATYAILKAGMIAPRFDPDLAIGDDAVLGRRDVPRGDRLFIFQWLFRLGTTPEAFMSSQHHEPGRIAGAAPDRGDLPPDTSPAAGDTGSLSGVLPEPGGVLGGIESRTEG